MTEFNNIYKEVLDNLHYGVFVTDENKNIIYGNKGFCKYYSVKIKDILGSNISILEPYIKKGNKIIPIVMKEKEEISLFQITKTGKKIFLTAKPILDEERKIKIIIVNCYEILSAKESIKTSITTNENLIISLDSDSYVRSSIGNEFKELSKIAKFDVTILLLGESGTGKSTCARLIHKLSKRKDKPFFTINCTTIPSNLIESELFGYKKGAFTGALTDGKKGLVELANEGTLFLDEIGELPLEAQSKLLELIEDKTYMPLGGNKKKSTNIRIITATNKNLRKLVEEGKFREDLYYRLNVIEFTIPSLKERKEDIPLLIKFFVDKINRKYKLKKTIKDEVIKEFFDYNWPGNIRELEHFIEKLLIETEEDNIRARNVKKRLKYFKPNYKEREENTLPSLKEHLERSERELIIAAYKKYNSSYKVAEALGISQSQASRKIRKYIIQ